jgi:hypothetical protein
LKIYDPPIIQEAHLATLEIEFPSDEAEEIEDKVVKPIPPG